MDDRQFLKPPSIGMWLTFALCLAILAAGLFGDVGEWVLLPIFGVCLIVSASVVFRWLGRWAGFVTSYVAREMVEGYREGYANAAARREATKR